MTLIEAVEAFKAIAAANLRFADAILVTIGVLGLLIGVARGTAMQTSEVMPWVFRIIVAGLLLASYEAIFDEVFRAADEVAAHVRRITDWKGFLEQRAAQAEENHSVFQSVKMFASDGFLGTMRLFSQALAAFATLAVELFARASAVLLYVLGPFAIGFIPLNPEPAKRWFRRLIEACLWPLIPPLVGALGFWTTRLASEETNILEAVGLNILFAAMCMLSPFIVSSLISVSGLAGYASAAMMFGASVGRSSLMRVSGSFVRAGKGLGVISELSGGASRIRPDDQTSRRVS